MIYSMTGFGKGTVTSAKRRITVEIKSLNSKQLDLMMRVPSVLREMEVNVRNLIAEKLERGKVEMAVSLEMTVPEASSRLNTEILADYKHQFEELGRTLDLPAPADWYSLLMRMPDVLKTETAHLDEDDKEAFRTAVESALDALTEFRRAEGAKLYHFFVKKIENISDLLNEVDPYEHERVPKIRQRLEEQLARLNSIEYDKGRLEQEMIFYIEKLDVNEEKLRLRSHLNYFLDTLGPVDEKFECGQGKKLGFIAQEMGREINTLGSKANHAGIQKIVVRMKDELEQIKEQVLNVL